MSKHRVLLGVLLAFVIALCPVAVRAEEIDPDPGPDPVPSTEPIGWSQLEGDDTWYYLDAEGNITTSSLVPYKSYTVYLTEDGHVRTVAGWLAVDGRWYYSAANGILYQNRWVQYNKYWYYLGDDCAMVTDGWVYSNKKWYYMDAGGNMSHGWVTINGSYYYFGADGAVYYSCFTPDGWHVGANGKADGRYRTWTWSGGTYTWEQVSGVRRTSLVSYLTNNWKRYYGTPYSSCPCSIPGVGMHCAGFVARTFYDMGVSDRFYAPSPGYYVEARNKGYLYKSNISSYTNENVWRVRGWLVWADTCNVRWIGYPSYAAAVKGAANGEFQKGDILIYVRNASFVYNNCTMSHVCFYWGDSSNWSRIWESSPWGNGIYSRSYYSGQIIVLTSVRS